ncbi:MAG: hypothetical protein ACYCYI_09875 [Saccharofermentanales bacterium]
MKNVHSKKRITVFLLMLFLLILSVGVIAVVNVSFTRTAMKNKISKDSSSIQLDSNGNAINGKYITKTPEQILAELEKAQINVTDKVSTSITFDSGEAGSIGAWVVENIASNTVIMQCEVYFNNSLLSKSVPIYPYEHINSINLLTSLSPGIYEVIAYINYFKLNTKEYIGKAGYKIKLIIQ